MVSMLALSMITLPGASVCTDAARTAPLKAVVPDVLAVSLFTRVAPPTAPKLMLPPEVEPTVRSRAPSSALSKATLPMVVFSDWSLPKVTAPL